MKREIFLSIILLIISTFNNFAQNQEKGITAFQSNLIYEISGQIDPIQVVRTPNIFDPTIRGITQSSIIGEFKVSGILYPADSLFSSTNKKDNNYLLQDYENWILCDSLYLSSCLSGSEYYGVKINAQDKKLEIISSNSLTINAKTAIVKAPKWIRQELAYTLSQLNQDRQNKFADIINNASEKLIDEISFSIAYSSPTFLNSSYCFPDLFLENAQLLYKHDSDLNYVEIIDYGTPTTDENYYSTIKYWKNDSVRGKIQIEVPMDIYYMYVVHPKITDEIQTYVNPNTVETNYAGWHINNIAAPPTGVFWRDYLYTHTEEIPDSNGKMYPILKDSVSICDVLWDDKNVERQAVKEVTKWVNDVMDFTSKNERPHQPVRIYDLHIGRCGEHEDITAAAARACLIPCRGIDAHSIDHVWNEFWDESWQQWEPVNNYYKMPLAYITWDTMGAVTARLSSGPHENITNTYNDNQTSQFTITALDASSKPIDGGIIKIYSNFFTQGQNYIIFDTYGITDNDGKCTFTLGKNKFYYIRLESDLGNNPKDNNQVLQINTNYSGVGMNYSYNISAPLSRNNPLTTVPIPDDTLNDYMLNINFATEKQAINWKLLLNDLGNETTFYTSQKPRDINLLILDEENYSKLITGENYVAYQQKSSNDELQFSIPIEKDWYVLLQNDMINNFQFVNGTFALYKDQNVGIAKRHDQINDLYLFPTPSKEFIDVAQFIGCEYKIYDLLGNCIKAGVIDSENIDLSTFQTGVYFIYISKVDKQIVGIIIKE